jgi:hypothetical protein
MALESKTRVSPAGTVGVDEARSLLEASDEMRAARPRRSGAHREPAGQLRLTGCGQCSAFFMPYADPLDLAPPYGNAQRVQRVADQGEDLLYADLLEDVDEGLSDSTRDGSLPWLACFHRNGRRVWANAAA